MRQVFVRVVQVNSVVSAWTLRTSNDNPVGSRLLTVDPEEGRELPLIPPTAGWTTKIDAERAAIRWNMYLRWAQDKKRKRTNKGTEE